MVYPRAILQPLAGSVAPSQAVKAILLKGEQKADFRDGGEKLAAYLR
jgi:hypothetical protein